MNLKVKIKQAIPPVILNNLLLRPPFLYQTNLVNYETNLQENRGIEDLLRQLDRALNMGGAILLNAGVRAVVRA